MIFSNCKKDSIAEEYFKLYLDPDTNPRFLRCRLEFKQYSINQAIVVKSNLLKSWNYPIFKKMRKKKLIEITRDDMLFLKIAINEDEKNKNDSSGVTKNKQLSCLKSIINEAISTGLINFGVTSDIAKFKEHPKPKIKAFTKKEIKQLLKKENYPYRLMYDVSIFLLHTGLRKGELAALTWHQIDEYNKYSLLNVDRAVKTRGGVGYPKWDKKRYIVLPQKAWKAIKYQEKDLRKTIFHTENSNYLTSNFFKDFNDQLKIITKNQNASMHMFRHNLNTWLLKNNISALKSSQFFGWSSEIIAKTQQGYTHLGIDDMEEVANMINNMFNF